MEENKTIFNYLADTLTVFGFAVIVLNIFCILFGEDAYGYSSIFQLGKEGLAVETAAQFLAVSFIITGLRFLFFSDRLIKNAPITLRAIYMTISVTIVSGIFSYAFSWFPINQWLPWGMFFLSYGICFALSFFASLLKEKAENRALEKALKKMQQKEQGKESDNYDKK